MAVQTDGILKVSHAKSTWDGVPGAGPSSDGDYPGLPFLGFGHHLGAVPPSGPTANAPAGSSSGIRRTIIGRAPAHEAGWETRLYLVEYPPGAAAPPHVHPVVGVGWVIEGEFESAFGEAGVTRVSAGQPFTDLANVRHRVFRNASADHPLRFVVAYTIRTGDENFRPLP